MSDSRISYEGLLAYAAGELAPADAARIEAALPGDPAARATVARFRAAASALAAHPGADPPPHVMAAALGLWRRLVGSRRVPWWVELRRVVATLVFDSRPRPALAGFRGGRTGFEISFEGGGVAVDLQVEPVRDAARDGAAVAARWSLLGQMDAPSSRPSGSAVALVATGEDETPALEAVADERGVFSMEVPAGRYDLFVRRDEECVVLPDLEFR